MTQAKPFQSRERKTVEILTPSGASDLEWGTGAEAEVRTSCPAQDLYESEVVVGRREVEERGLYPNLSCSAKSA